MQHLAVTGARPGISSRRIRSQFKQLPIHAALGQRGLDAIATIDSRLHDRFNLVLRTDEALSRSLVSYQESKTRPVYRWYKYKEAFSASLVEYLLHEYKICPGRLLDPFAGSGAALFAASAMGIEADGIEVLPIGQRIVEARQRLQDGFEEKDFIRLKRWVKNRPWISSPTKRELPELRITSGAYPPETVGAIERYLGAIEKETERVRQVLFFALLCVLESVSFTRKDGQYLRWDFRSSRRQGSKPFNKGIVANFDTAICVKIGEIIADSAGEADLLDKAKAARTPGEIRLLRGSCLEILPALDAASYDVVMTSPPYCNRYDYTRTYALELAMQRIGEKEITQLRQQMLSCTVENRAKDLLAIKGEWSRAIQAANEHDLLQQVLSYLETQKAENRLNNNGIPRMVRGYFYEMACVIQECARVLRKGGWLFMVNDNVRYAGASISVDLILSSIAEQLGFSVERILTLPRGKGNSSQQMGEHGRDPLRKCVYVWRRK